MLITDARITTIGAICLLAGCATTEARPVRYDYPMSTDLRLDLTSIEENQSGKIEANVRLSNVSDKSLCLTEDSLRNPISFEMNFYARTDEKRMLSHAQFDLMPIPIEGERELAPSMATNAVYNVSDRFPSIANSDASVEILATYTFRECEAAVIKMTDTGWQQLQIVRRETQ